MRTLVLACSIALIPLPVAYAELSIGIAMPGISIGLNMPSYPQLERVPGYPVYYAPNAEANFFFYDGLYWVYQSDDWYASSWYNGPWRRVAPTAVPLYVLRVPVRYYRHPPPHFEGWRRDAPPRWGEHWGPDWEDQHRDWDRWDRTATPRPAPLPTYQRGYSGDRYPRNVVEQRDVQARHYRYQPVEPIELRTGSPHPADISGHETRSRSSQAPQRATTQDQQYGPAEPEHRRQNKSNDGDNRDDGPGNGKGEGQGKGHR